MINSTNKEDVVAFKDERFLILHAKDRFNGVRVQLYAFVEQRRQEKNGDIVNLGVQPVLLEEKAVPFTEAANGKAVGSLRDPKKFRDDVLAAEGYIRTQMSNFYTRMEDMADGVLNDLRSKYGDLNGGSRTTAS